MSIVEENYQRWLESEKVSEETKEELRAMTPEEIDDAFFKDIEFGTGGMRGILGPGTNRMNAFTIKRVTVAFGKSLLLSGPDAAKRGVVISHDNRFFSREFAELSADVLNEMGINAFLFDSLRPTPELSYGVRYMHAIGGIMITASHNPKEYNGYKIYDEKGCQLTPSKIQPMLDILSELPGQLEVEPEAAEVRGKTVILPPAVDDAYVREVEATQVNPKLNKKGFKIVFTPNHGTSYENGVRVFQECGYEFYPLEKQCVHDPAFGATLSPNPEVADAYIEPIKYAKELGAQLIVMTDPDGDRCGLAYLDRDGEYKRLTGNESAALLIDYILSERKRKGLLHENGVIYDTIVTSCLGKKIAAHYGIATESFLTGFKFIGDRIAYYEERGFGPVFEFGYEESYGCLIQPFVRDKDGLQAILLYSEMALFHYRKGKNLGEAFDDLQKEYGYHYAKQDNFFFAGSAGAEEMKRLMNSLHDNPPQEVEGIKAIRVEDYMKMRAKNADGTTEILTLPKAEVVKLFFEDGSWIAVRPSGTEPKCKFYIEVISKEKEGLHEKANHLSKSLQNALGM